MKRLSPVALKMVLVGCLIAMFTACTTTYVAAMKQFGYETRDLLVDQVKDTRVQQEETKEEFTSALEQFKATFNYDGGDLQDAYEKLQDEYDGCAAEADDLKGEIAAVKRLGKAMFAEWEDEIDQQTIEEYKSGMVKQRKDTMKSYDQMVAKMDQAAGKMQPVLEAFKGRVLFLKSSLNAQAIASLQTNADELVGGIETLIAEMNKSIAEADEFIAAMSNG